jgi:hypothetical protein
MGKNVEDTSPRRKSLRRPRIRRPDRLAALESASAEADVIAIPADADLHPAIPELAAHPAERGLAVGVQVRDARLK